MLDPGQIRRLSDLAFYGGDPFGKTAWIDPVKMGEIGVDVEGKAMHGDTALDGDAHGDNFVFADPDARIFVETLFCADAKFILEQIDQGRGNGCDVSADAAGEILQGDDWITNDLARSMVGDISATFNFENGDPLLGECFFR